MSTPAPAPAPTRTMSASLTRTGALARAEWLQFYRNRLLVFLAFVFPPGLAIGLFLVTKNAVGTIEAASVIGLETLILFALLFIQFYSVLSMVTTRRDEKVLKRLRTGELRDHEILCAISIPGALLTIVLTVFTVIVLMLVGVPAPLSPVPVVIAVLLGIVVSAALALITAGFTSNAEAAQMTSIPVMVLALISQSSLRSMLGDNVSDVLAYNPFALVVDLVTVGWFGTTTPGLASGMAPSAYEILVQALPRMGVLALWALALGYLAPRLMAWETNR